jgi:tetratricopeptide (TPR) repeat protein
LAEQGKLDAALDLCNLVTNPVIRAELRGRVYERKGDFQSALYQYVESKNEQRVIRCLGQLCQWQDIINRLDFQKHKSAWAWNELANAKRALGRQSEARACYQEALNQLQKETVAEEASVLQVQLRATILVNLGHVSSSSQEMLRHYEQALRCFKACQDVQAQSRTLRYIAHVHARLGQWRDADMYAKKSMELNPLDPEAIKTYAHLRRSIAAARRKQ